MSRGNKIYFLGIAMLLAVASIFGAAYFYYSKKPAAAKANSLDAVNISKSGDFQPLAVPPEAVQKGRAIALPILMYHHVGSLPAGADKIQADLTVRSVSFEAQAKWLKENGYQSVSLNDIYLASLGKFVLPKKPVVFTFDDGYEDVFQNAVPILKKYGFSGSFGIITKKPGTSAGLNFYAPWGDIAAAYMNGEEVVSHTQTHFDGSNPKYTAGYIYGELSGSMADIKNRLDITTNILIYPYGHYTPTYIVEAKKAGYVMGITVHEGDIVNLDDLMRIPRVRVHGAETLRRFEDVLLHRTESSTTTPAKLTRPR
ncbi:MAG: polysaccharide deacetylase family protein [Candidatus Doudnabacteria bacterium]|nr:polysaccharide deacetylase family protein [Candidatus Doudnabacteria bacterium]